MSNIKNKLARDYVADRLRTEGYKVTEDPIKVTLPGGTVVDVAVRSRWTGNGEAWWITDDDVEARREDLIFVFVNAVNDDLVCFVVPSLAVVKAATAREEAWKAADPENRHGTPGRMVFSQNRENSWDVPGYPAGWLNRYRDAWVMIDFVEHGH